MKNKTILGMWCTNSNCKFIDSKHIQTELVAHIWYAYDNDSKTDVINKKLCSVNEIDFNELNDEVEILEEEPRNIEVCGTWFTKSEYDKLAQSEEEKKLPEKIKWNQKSQHNSVTDNTKKTLEHLLSRSEQLKKSTNEIITYLDYLKSKGE